jgi:hypothetical protein
VARITGTRKAPSTNTASPVVFFVRGVHARKTRGHGTPPPDCSKVTKGVEGRERRRRQLLSPPLGEQSTVGGLGSRGRNIDQGFDHDCPWWSVLHPFCSVVQAIMLAPTGFPQFLCAAPPTISFTNALLREGGMLIRLARDVSYRTEERLAGSGSRYPRRTGGELTDPLQAAEVQAARSASCYGRGPRSPS